MSYVTDDHASEQLEVARLVALDGEVRSNSITVRISAYSNTFPGPQSLNTPTPFASSAFTTSVNLPHWPHQIPVYNNDSPNAHKHNEAHASKANKAATMQMEILASPNVPPEPSTMIAY